MCSQGWEQLLQTSAIQQKFLGWWKCSAPMPSNKVITGHVWLLTQLAQLGKWMANLILLKQPDVVCRYHTGQHSFILTRLMGSYVHEPFRHGCIASCQLTFLHLSTRNHSSQIPWRSPDILSQEAQRKSIWHDLFFRSLYWVLTITVSCPCSAFSKV